jgi:hypothetical protein
MSRKNSKKKENNVLYTGIIIAIIALSSFLIYTQTDIFRTSDTVTFTRMNYEYGIYPELQEFYSYDQISDYSSNTAYTLGNDWDSPYFLSQSFRCRENNLAGFGLVIGKEITDPLQLNVYIALWLDDPGELVYIADGVISASLIPTVDTPYIVYCKIDPPINMMQGSEYYIVLTTNQEYRRWQWYGSEAPHFDGGEAWYYHYGSWQHWESSDFFFFTEYYAGYCENPFGYDEEIKHCGDPDYNQKSTHDYRCEGDTGEWEDLGSTCDTDTPCPACYGHYEMSLWWIWLLIIIILIIIAIYSYYKKKKQGGKKYGK